jgi:hypothetical protein
MYRFVFVLCLIASVLMTGASVAEIPRLINYQGMLTDNSGSPLTDTVDVAFIIYDNPGPTGGNVKWSETQYNVSVINGLFNVILGSANPIDLPFDQDYWLDITVEGEHLPERLKFTSVGYAYRALVADSARVATPGSGSHWTVADSVLYSNKYWGIARGGAGNVLYGDSAHTTVNLGVACTTGASGQNYYYPTVGGGYGNRATAWYTTVAGGSHNIATGECAMVGGGWGNIADNDYAMVGGGSNNVAGGYLSTLCGGADNRATGWMAVLGGGWHNEASGHKVTVGGGAHNFARGAYSVVAGGGGSGYPDSNSALGDYSTIPGGTRNVASGNYSFAAGRRAHALHHGSFVWADTTDADFASTGDNQFLIRASGGVGVGTNNPRRLLHLLAANPRVLIEASSSNPEINFENSGDAGSEIWALYKDGASDDFRFFQNGADRLTFQNATGNVGVGATDPGQKLDVNGIVRIRSWGLTPTYNVEVNADGDLCKASSSRRYKKNIRSLESDPDKILNLEPVSFEWKTTSEKGIGLIAEDVQELIPELVGYDKEGRPDAVRYELLSLYVLETVKQQQQTIQELKAENEVLKRRIEVLEGERR